MRLLLAVLVLAIATPPSPDSGLKIVTIQDHAEGPSGRTTEYIGRDRRRMEVNYGPRSAFIIRCDLGQQIYVNLDARDYMTMTMPHRGGVATTERVALLSRPPATAPATEPTITIEVTTTDTGERKQLFGHLARHVITVQKQTASDPAIAPRTEMKTDGWYIDLDAGTECEPQQGQSTGSLGHLFIGGPTGSPRMIFTERGAAERGFPVDVTFTHSDWRARTTTRKVTELTSGPLDPALFEAPAGFYHSNRWDRVMMMRAVQMWQQFQIQAWHQLHAHARSVFGWDR